MNISYDWIRELTPTSLSPRELSERLTMAGLAVESVQEVGGDFVLDFDLTSNRPDCLSHLGIAREIAALDGTEIRLPESTPQTLPRGDSLALVEIEDVESCPRYAASIIQGVSVAPSPPWLVKRLETIGQRAINNVTDITNYVLHELGQPLHAFDLAKIPRRKIVVRRARANEHVRTLDGIERQLSHEMLVIADSGKPIAVAGVMGGRDSEISNSTSDVLIESAYFAPEVVRRSARLLGLHTEASHRFERGIDPEGTIRALERSVHLIREIAGGVSHSAIDVYPVPVPRKNVALRFKRIRDLSGLSISPVEVSRILLGLGFQTVGAQSESTNGHVVSHGVANDRIEFWVPTWRVDVDREEDLVEEVARCFGYDRIGTELPPSNTAGEYHHLEKRRREVRRTLKFAGYDEAISFSFIESAKNGSFDPLLPPEDDYTGNGFVMLDNPILEEAATMRSTLLPGLVDAAKLNFNHGSKNVRLFEIGRVFSPHKELGNLPTEKESLAMLATGEVVEEGRPEGDRTLDFYDIKGAIEAAINPLKTGEISFGVADSKHLQPGQQARIYFSGRAIGSAGRLSDSLSRSYKLRQEVFVAELDLQALLTAPEEVVLYKPLPRYPSIIRDMSLVLDKQIELDKIVRAASDLGITDCRSVRFVRAYEGENIESGKRSLTLRVEYRSDTRTLRDQEVDQMNSMIVDALSKRFGAYIRS